jgi:predicted transcriptional regulator
MEIRLEPELAAKVEQWSAETGRPASELAEDAFAAYFAEVGEIRQMLDSRYDDLASGRVRPIPGEEAYEILKERARARRKSA